tara:strand:- start:1428 stop:2603 length:1176 start_codon:yes stop_codon:yes gene_type:complete
MKILIISHKPVFPSVDGGSVAVKKLYYDLRTKYKSIDIIALDSNIKGKTYLKNHINQTLFQINKKFNFLKLVNSLFSKKCYQTNRFYNKKVSRKITHTINEKKYEYVLFEGVFPSVYLQDIKNKCKCKTIIRTHNVEHEIWNDLISNTKNLLKKIIYFFLKLQMKKWENFICSKCDFLFCISKNDKKYFKKNIKKRIEILPVSFKIKNRNVPKEFSIFHLGAMDWKPNLEGIEWFLNNVWIKHLVNKKIGTLHLAGKNMPNHLKKQNYKSLKVKGLVDNSESYMIDKSVMIVPIFSGSGIRIKILEGMSMGIPIISTKKGAQGINCKNNKNILICNNEIEFSNSIKNLKSNVILFNKLSQGGKKLINEYFSTKVVIKNWKKLIYEDSNNNS